MKGMAMTIVEVARAVTGGVDTPLDVHVAAALDPVGGLLGVESFPTTPAGYRSLVDWMSKFGPLQRVGIEGTGAYGAGLARYLNRRGVEVIEVDRANRQARRAHGKSDPVDAVEAARAALSGRASGLAKSRDGNVEAIRTLIVARRSAPDMRIKSINQIRHLSFTAPDELRERLRPLTATMLPRVAAGLRPRVGPDPVLHATKLSIATLGRRVVALDAEAAALDKSLGELVAAGDNPQRLRSEAAWAHLYGVAPIEASSGKVTRHRLNRGGNRQANSALWRIVMVRTVSDPRTRDYVERRTKEGRSKLEMIRVLKRYVARQVYPHLPRL
jgi:transposase